MTPMTFQAIVVSPGGTRPAESGSARRSRVRPFLVLATSGTRWSRPLSPPGWSPIRCISAAMNRAAARSPAVPVSRPSSESCASTRSCRSTSAAVMASTGAMPDGGVAGPAPGPRAQPMRSAIRTVSARAATRSIGMAFFRMGDASKVGDSGGRCQYESEPAAFEACSPEPPHQPGGPSHEIPDEPGPIVLDQQNNGPLVEPERPGRDTAAGAPIHLERRVEGGPESVVLGSLQLELFAQKSHGRDYDLGRHRE